LGVPIRYRVLNGKDPTNVDALKAQVKELENKYFSPFLFIS